MNDEIEQHITAILHWTETKPEDSARELRRFLAHIEARAKDLRAAITAYEAAREPLDLQLVSDLLIQKVKDHTAYEAAREPVAITDEMVTAFMREFEKWTPLLRYKEAEKWHLTDIQGVRHALKAALTAALKDPSHG